MSSRAIDLELTPQAYEALGQPADTTPERRIPGDWHPDQSRTCGYHLTRRAYAALAQPAVERTP